MTAADIGMVVAMLSLIHKHSMDKGENDTAQDLEIVINTLKDLQKKSLYF